MHAEPGGGRARQIGGGTAVAERFDARKPQLAAFEPIEPGHDKFRK
jgi:hypothetical protein